MEAKKTLLTYTGLKKLEDELENLKVVKRKEVAGKIKEAREQSTMQQRTSSVISRHVSKNLRKSSRMQKL